MCIYSIAESSEDSIEFSSNPEELLGLNPRYYQRTVIVLDDHPRWMFKKNSMGFFVALSCYLYYFTVAVLLKVHNHISFQNVL